MAEMTDAPGLRERKRRATHRAIQIAALTLVADRGLDKVTIDDISSVADISPRTFFNYFASKEEALVGEGPRLPEPEAVEAFIEAGPAAPLIGGIADLIVHGAESSLSDRETVTLRREVLKDYPQLFVLRMASMHQFEAGIEGIVARRIANDDPDGPADASGLHLRASLVTMVVVGVMRHAWMSWADSTAGDSLSERLRASFDGLESLLRTGRA